MHDLDEHDIVRVSGLKIPEREVDGTFGATRQPQVGDLGAVVLVLDDDEFVVECIDSAGHTVWLCQFHCEELELVEAHRRE